MPPGLKKFIQSWLINTLAVLVAVYVVDGIHYGKPLDLCVASLLLGILQRDFQHAKVFGLKDPRMCRLMPLWFRIFDAAKIDPFFILSIRHPSEVAGLLRRRFSGSGTTG